MQEGMISNGTYVIKRLKAIYSTFRNHLDKLDKEEKILLREEYDRAFKAYTLLELSEKVSNAIQAAGTRIPSIADIQEAKGVVKQAKNFSPNQRLEAQYGTALLKYDWKEMQRLRTALATDRLAQINPEAFNAPTYRIGEGF